eukprot:108209_1
MEDLDTIHTKLQTKLKEIETASDLIPFIEKTVSITNLKAEIATALEEQCAKEKKAENTEEPSVIRDLFAIISAPKKDPKEDAIIDDQEKENKAMKPRKADDDAKSDDEGAPKKTPKTNPKSRDNTFNRPRPQRFNNPPQWSNSICYNCNEKGHFARECPRSRGPSRRYNNNSQRCYHCGKDGHLARNCPDEGDDELNDKCFRCGKMGHWARDCDQRKESRNRNDKCHRCGKSGHWARDCDLPYQSNNFKDNDKCNRCGKIGHWARDCELPRNDGYGQEDETY